MFLIVGGRGYHDLRVRVMLRSWARCVLHVLVFTDPSVNVADYLSPYRFVYLAAGDAWRKRPYLPMTHMDGVFRLLSRQNVPSSTVKWFFLVSDRTFVNVPLLLQSLSTLEPTTKGYYGQVANASHKESFGFHEYLDLNTGVLLSAPLMLKVADPENCHDQKSAGGTFDMFDAKLGNCVFYLGAYPQRLPGIGDQPMPSTCDRALPGISYHKADPQRMLELSSCAGLLNASTHVELSSWVQAQVFPVTQEQVTVHVMARETQLRGIVGECEDTWAKGVSKLYYHADRLVAAQEFTISRGRWGISANLVPPEEGKGGSSPPFHRVAALNLPERPDTQGEHWTVSHDKGMSWNTWLRFKMKAIFEYSVRAQWKELQGAEWYVYVDDDTYLLMDKLMELLQRYDPNVAHYFGRPLHEEGYPVFVGGGAGIVLSRAAALQIIALKDSPECDPLALKWSERLHQGGDAWLGDCADAAGVHTDMEYGFYPQPPVANLFHLFDDAVTFHGVEEHAAMYLALEAHNSTVQFDPRCVPYFADHKYRCLPHFLIGGVPKAGTTSLYKYLLQHPDMLPAEDKELTFWGNFFNPKRRPSRTDVTTTYLPKFPKIEPSDFKVTGEATPGYLYCSTCPLYILKYMPKVRIIFSFRNPISRAYSEYLNKVVDRTVVRYLNKRINRKMDKELSDDSPSFASLVDDVSTTMKSCSPNRTFSMMDEFTAEAEEQHCYVNPFVGEGRYARYLRNWLSSVPKRQILLLNFDEWTNNAAQAMRTVADFLQLPLFDFKLDVAHNAHLARSVHVAQEGAANLSMLKEQMSEDQIPFEQHCILHDFFKPFHVEFDELLAQYGYPAMVWDTSHKDGQQCASDPTSWAGAPARRKGGSKGPLGEGARGAGDGGSSTE